MINASPMTFKVTDYIEPDLAWEAAEAQRLGIGFGAYQLLHAGPDEILRHVADADVLLVNMTVLDARVIDGLEKTCLILRHGIGYDKVDVAAATRNGIIFANQALASSVDVAEHAIMLLMATWRKLGSQRRILEQWTESRTYPVEKLHSLNRLEDHTIGIVGCGKIGSIVLRKLRSYGARILVHDPLLGAERLAQLGVENTPWDELLAEADILTLHVPLETQTRRMFNMDVFRRMKPGAMLVNTARGGLVDTADLAQALREGLLGGAGLDVLEDEPPRPDLDLLQMDNVVITPHCAWFSEQGAWEIRRTIMDDVVACLEGRLPRFVVNPEVLDQPNLRMKLSNSRLRQRAGEHVLAPPAR